MGESRLSSSTGRVGRRVAGEVLHYKPRGRFANTTIGVGVDGPPSSGQELVIVKKAR
jgi:hypothetical protein